MHTFQRSELKRENYKNWTCLKVRSSTHILKCSILTSSLPANSAVKMRSPGVGRILQIVGYAAPVLENCLTYYRFPPIREDRNSLRTITVN